MWIKYNENQKAEFVKPVTILDINQGLNITGRTVNSARGILTLHCENGQQITCKPHKTDYQEWLNMLRLSREAINTQPA